LPNEIDWDLVRRILTGAWRLIGDILTWDQVFWDLGVEIANPNVTGFQNSGLHVSVKPSYLLVSSADYDALDQRYQAQGYVRIGESNWTGGLDGMPERELALNYARKIGADRVLYYCTGSTEWVEGMQRTDHNIRFYAKTDQSSVPTVTTSKVN
jgi:hypothetical protein